MFQRGGGIKIRSGGFSPRQGIFGGIWGSRTSTVGDLSKSHPPPPFLAGSREVNGRVLGGTKMGRALSLRFVQ